LQTLNQPRPNWEPLPRPGCREVEGRVLLASADLLIANLRFSDKATIDEHAAPNPIDVLCIGGSGFVSVGEELTEIKAGENIHWPAHLNHRLWTHGSAMETLMVERKTQA